MSPLLTLSGVVVELGGRTVLDGVRLNVAAGEVVGLVGANGSGKTTLLRAAAGLVKPSGGYVTVGGDDPRRLDAPTRAERMGYMAQERIIGWNMPAWRVVALGAPLLRERRARELASACLAEVGLGGFEDRRALELSGGERARVLLARLLATRAPLLLADEPAAGLDPAAQWLTLEVLRARAKAGGAVLLTLHDLTLAVRTCDRLAVLKDGRFVALGPVSVLNDAAMRVAFGLEGEIVETRAGLVVATQRPGGT